MKHIRPFLDSKKIDEIEALKSLQNFDHILGVRFYKDLLNEYFIRNSGFTPNPRKADVNDHFDVEHLRHLPYVDCFVTERFFGDIAVKIAAKYNGKVFKNLKELRLYLESIK